MHLAGFLERIYTMMHDIANFAGRRDAYTLDMLEIPQGAGSGLIWDKTGHIVTNYHVIRGATELQVCHAWLQPFV